jgi:glycoprotein-N-acetylgalactosamine 3-beta-galactosyltransferase
VSMGVDEVEFAPSRDVPIACPLQWWDWDVENKDSTKYCGFLSSTDSSAVIEDNSAQLRMTANCRSRTLIPYSLFFQNRHLLHDLSPARYEKKYVYFKLSIHYEFRFAGARPTTNTGSSPIKTQITTASTTTDSDDATSSWINSNKSSQNSNNNISRGWTTTGQHFHVVLGEYNWSVPISQSHTALGNVTGEFAYNIGWLYSSPQPTEDQFLLLTMSVTHNSTDSTTGTLGGNDEEEEVVDIDLDKLRSITITNMSISVVSQPNAVPLKYSIDNIERNNSHKSEGRFDDQVKEPCRLSIDEARALDQVELSSSTLPSLPSESESESESVLRIFCGIFTTARHHDTKVRAIRDTWGKKCTFFLVFSTADDLTIPAIHLPHIGDEMYNNMWQKSRSIWKYIHEHYRHAFDWFLLGGDDMFYIMENLVSFLRSDVVQAEHRSPSSSGVYIGRRLRLPRSEEKGHAVYFNTGGPGYLLNNKAVGVFNSIIDHERCFPLVLKYAEDALLAGCLMREGNLRAFPSTNDDLGRPRFHMFSPSATFAFNVSDRTHWTAEYEAGMKAGQECCSPSSISFHDVNETGMYAMYDYFYRCRHSQQN